MRQPFTNKIRPAALVLLPLTLLLAGCGGTPHKLSFAALGPESLSTRPAPRAQPQPKGPVLSMAGGAVQLAAPADYCFDTSSSKLNAGGGFVLMAHCSRTHGNGWFAARNAPVLTASVGPADKRAVAPQATDIAALFPHAKVLKTRNDQLLPLVLLEAPKSVAAGASPVHWRGAFVLDQHLVALALYAPKDSPALGPQGAALLNETTHRTLEASSLPPLEEARSSPPAATPRAAVTTTAAPLRPRPRPASMRSAETNTDPTPKRRKRGLGQRIAGLFQ